MSEYVTPIVNSIVDKFAMEMQKKEIRDKIMEQICLPILKDISSKYYIYFMSIIIFLVVIILLLLALLITAFVGKKI